MQRFYDVAQQFYQMLQWAEEDGDGFDSQTVNLDTIIAVRKYEIRHNMFDTLLLKLKTKHSSS
jgi:hypothetical protein